MIIIRNKFIPFSGYKAILICCFLFVRPKVKLTEVFLNHEEIHSRQCNEMLWVFFYIWYIIEWLIKLIYYLDFDKAYKSVSFEREAYENETNLEYLNSRKHYSWIKYVIKSDS